MHSRSTVPQRGSLKHGVLLDLVGWRILRSIGVRESSKRIEFHCGFTTMSLQIQKKLADRNESVLTSMAHAKCLPKRKKRRYAKRLCMRLLAIDRYPHQRERGAVRLRNLIRRKTRDESHCVTASSKRNSRPDRHNDISYEPSGDCFSQKKGRFE